MDRDVVWVGDSGGPKEPCIRWGSGSSQGERAILMVAHWKALWVTAALYATKKSITASVQLLVPTALLPTGQCHINFSPMKNLPSVMRPLVKILWPFVILLVNFWHAIVLAATVDRAHSDRSYLRGSCSCAMGCNYYNKSIHIPVLTWNHNFRGGSSTGRMTMV